MKKYLNRAMIFAVYGLASGVYFRELTKIKGFTGRTMLGMAHPHILMLGLGGYLAVALFARTLNIPESRKIKTADIFYIAGLAAASVMMIFRGTLEVLDCTVSGSLSGMISGIAGLGHISVAVGMILFINAFKKADSGK